MSWAADTSTRALVLALALAPLGCGGGGGKPGPDATADGFDRRALLAQLANGVLLPAHQDFDTSAAALRAAADAYCAALGGEDELARRDEARTAWRAAMASWQVIEAMLLGPAAMDERTLRDRIYSWPVVSSCAVDQDVVLRWNDPGAYAIETRLVNRRGLPALEYVLFSDDLAMTCPPQTAPAGWDALSDAEKRSARCGFAAVAAADLAAQAQTLVQAWSPAGGNYVAVLAAAGERGSPFASPHAGLNVVSDAMFHLDSIVKDMKLAEPAGITLNSCGTVAEPCLAELESRWADVSKENVVANLHGFRRLLTGDVVAGTGSLGFDDFLIALNAGDVATRMTTAVDEAIVAVEAIPGKMATALLANRDSVVAAHTAIKKVTDLLKTEFLTVLGLDIPDDAAGDND